MRRLGPLKDKVFEGTDFWAAICKHVVMLFTVLLTFVESASFKFLCRCSINISELILFQENIVLGINLVLITVESLFFTIQSGSLI